MLVSIRKAVRKATATVAAVAVASGLVVAGTGTAAAANRDWLRPDATGRCEWDAAKYWVQRCDVFSPAMGRNVTVQIQPAQRGGNAGLYLLDGARATERSNAWVVDTNAHAKFVNNNITLVMPVGGAGSFYTDWLGDPMLAPAAPGSKPQKFMWETFLTKELPGYLERHFGVSRTNNSIGGLSMGATAAMNLAALHPAQFRQVLSYSGYLTQTLPGVDTLLRLALIDVGGLNINSMYGDYTNPRRYQLDPYLNLEGLRGKDVYVSAASGAWGPVEAALPLEQRINGSILEAASQASTRTWENKARSMNLNVTSNYPPIGIHNWAQWNYQLDITRKRILDVMRAW